MATDSTDDLLAALLRGEPVVVAPDAIDALVGHATTHGVAPLLHDRCSRAGAAGLAGALTTAAVSYAAWEMGHTIVLRRGLAALAGAGLRPILFKGTALAHSLYPAPNLRARGDTDLILRPGDREAATHALRQFGFRQLPGTPSYQDSFVLQVADGSEHALDVHWRINNSEVLARLFTHEELAARAFALPSLSPDAWAASAVDNLLLTCMHRATHRTNPYYVDGHAHFEPDRLIWLHDIHLLAHSLAPHEWRRLEELARAKELCAVVEDGFAAAAARFPMPPHAPLAPKALVERPATYLRAGRLRQAWMDFAALATIGDQARHAAATLFPPRQYMTERFGSASALAYATRLVGGVSRRIRRESAP